MSHFDNLLVTICARGGSKGIPGKNIKPVGGKPLLAYTAAVALEFAKKHGADLIVSSDSQAILDTAAQCGLNVDYKRPDYLADDICGKPDAIRHAMLYGEQKRGRHYDMVVDLDVTSPIRTLPEVEQCVVKMHECPEALTIFSVSPCGRNPYFSMVQQKENGFYGTVCDGKFTSRQTAPKVYDMNGSIYVYRREALLPEHPRAVTDRSLVYVMDHICFDLDEPEDYDYLSYLVETGRVNI